MHKHNITVFIDIKDETPKSCFRERILSQWTVPLHCCSCDVVGGKPIALLIAWSFFVVIADLVIVVVVVVVGGAKQE